MQYFHPPLTSCINYLICNNYIKSDVEINIYWSKLILGVRSTSKCNTHISIMTKPHVEHDTCNIHIQTNFKLGKHINIQIVHN